MLAVCWRTCRLNINFESALNATEEYQRVSEMCAMSTLYSLWKRTPRRWREHWRKILSAVYSARPVAESVRNGTDSLAHHQRQQQLHKQFCTEPGIIERPFKLPLPVWRSISTDDAESKERRSKIRLQRSALTLFTEFQLWMPFWIVITFSTSSPPLPTHRLQLPPVELSPAIFQSPCWSSSRTATLPLPFSWRLSLHCHLF